MRFKQSKTKGSRWGEALKLKGWWAGIRVITSYLVRLQSKRSLKRNAHAKEFGMRGNARWEAGFQVRKARTMKPPPAKGGA